MSVDDLVKKDSSFGISNFISAANSMYVMLQSAVMLGNLSRVKSKISDKVLQKYQHIIDEFNNNNLRQMYEDINIKKTEVLSITNKDNDYYIQVLITSLAKDYVVDKKNLEYRYGVNNQKITKSNYLTFRKDYNDINNPWILDDIYTN
jgi:predicted lipid-binding transport protein (Tim44 family)